MDDLELDLSYEAIANSTPLHVPLSILQGPENRIPGPAGRPAIVPGSASAGRGGGGAGGNFTQGGTPIEFVGNEWQTALRMLGISDFNENDPSLRGCTISAAKALKQSGIIPKLLGYVVSIQHAHNGESYVKFRDPTGSISATFTADVLTAHPQISRGAVVLLENVTVLKTPAPHSIHHLCIISETVMRVFPRQRSSSSSLQNYNNSLLLPSAPPPFSLPPFTRGARDVAVVSTAAPVQTQPQQRQQPVPSFTAALMPPPPPHIYRNNNTSQINTGPAPSQQYLAAPRSVQVVAPPPVVDEAVVVVHPHASEELFDGLDDDEFGF